MNIQIDGAATMNKGGELMLYSVLEQIEKRYPNANVYWNAKLGAKSDKYIDTSLNFHKRWLMEKFGGVFLRLRLVSIFRKLKLPYRWMNHMYGFRDKKMDVIFDASGYAYCDGRHSSWINDLEHYLRKCKRDDVKIFFLPQAFGPFNSSSGQKIAMILNNYSDMLIAREPVSEKHLLKANIPPEKILIYPDFTCLCEGVFPSKYENVKGKVCIIPNVRMIKDANVLEADYLLYIKNIINLCFETGKDVFLLNHENDRDQILCEKINGLFDNKLSIVCDLKAKEIKGVIKESYAVISARYHGIANALNSGVPCLANSWSYKYELLFKEFGQENMILDIKSTFSETKDAINMLLHEESNQFIRKQLKEQSMKIKDEIESMWEKIWEYVEK